MTAGELLDWGFEKLVGGCEGAELDDECRARFNFLYGPVADALEANGGFEESRKNLAKVLKYQGAVAALLARKLNGGIVTADFLEDGVRTMSTASATPLCNGI